jgi:ribosomal protein L1
MSLKYLLKSAVSSRPGVVKLAVTNANISDRANFRSFKGRSKRYLSATSGVNRLVELEPIEALKRLKVGATTKFNETVEVR